MSTPSPETREERQAAGLCTYRFSLPGSKVTFCTNSASEENEFCLFHQAYICKTCLNFGKVSQAVIDNVVAGEVIAQCADHSGQNH